MKPHNIFLIRHGESEGNVNKQLYLEKPDYAYRLTALGREQAHKAGADLNFRVHGKPIAFYYSPYWRTRDTFLEIAKETQVWKAKEDARLREQEWGTSFEQQPDNLDKKRDAYGHFYFRIPGGESCADGFDRVSDFCGTLWRDFTNVDFPNSCAIVSHGMTIREFLMRWLHYRVEEFEILANPVNCQIIHLCLNHLTDKYELVGELKKYPSYNHPYQYPDLGELNKYRS